VSDDREQSVEVLSPKEYRGGRVKVYGCSPGCLIASLSISILLTILVNLLIRAF
jgi:hypothetical protein